jgi:hypothetical protein
MKKYHSWIIGALFGLFTTAAIQAEEQDEWKFTLGGHTSIKFGSDEPFSGTDPGPYVDSFGMVFRPIFSASLGPWTFAAEGDLAQSLVNDAQWVKALNAKYQIDDVWSIRAGYLCTASIYFTQPQRLVQTVRYQRMPIGVRGLGAQVQWKDGNTQVLWDVTSNTSLGFHHDTSLDGIETSARVQQQITDDLFVGGNVSYGFDDEYLFLGADIGYKKGPWDLHLVGYGTNDLFGFWTYTGYRINDLVEIHAGLDYQENGGFDQVIGTRFFFGKDDKIDFTADYIHNAEDGDEHIATFRLRWRW